MAVSSVHRHRVLATAIMSEFEFIDKSLYTIKSDFGRDI